MIAQHQQSCFRWRGEGGGGRGEGVQKRVSGVQMEADHRLGEAACTSAISCE